MFVSCPRWQSSGREGDARQRVSAPQPCDKCLQVEAIFMFVHRSRWQSSGRAGNASQRVSAPQPSEMCLQAEAIFMFVSCSPAGNPQVGQAMLVSACRRRNHPKCVVLQAGAIFMFVGSPHLQSAGRAGNASQRRCGLRGLTAVVAKFSVFANVCV